MISINPIIPGQKEYELKERKLIVYLRTIYGSRKLFSNNDEITELFKIALRFLDSKLNLTLKNLPYNSVAPILKFFPTIKDGIEFHKIRDLTPREMTFWSQNGGLLERSALLMFEKYTYAASRTKGKITTGTLKDISNAMAYAMLIVKYKHLHDSAVKFYRKDIQIYIEDKFLRLDLLSAENKIIDFKLKNHEKRIFKAVDVNDANPLGNYTAIDLQLYIDTFNKLFKETFDIEMVHYMAIQGLFYELFKNREFVSKKEVLKKLPLKEEFKEVFLNNFIFSGSKAKDKHLYLLHKASYEYMEYTLPLYEVQLAEETLLFSNYHLLHQTHMYVYYKYGFQKHHFPSHQNEFDMGLKSVSNLMGERFENFCTSELNKIGIYGKGSKGGVGKKRFQISISNVDGGQIDFLGYSPHDNALYLFDAKLIHSKSTSTQISDDIDHFFIDKDKKKSHVTKLEKKLLWVKNNIEKVKKALESEFSISIPNDCKKIISGFITYEPSEVDYFSNKYPIITIFELLDMYVEKGQWSENRGILKL